VLFAMGAVQALSSGETVSESLRRLFGRLRPRCAADEAPLDRSEQPPRRDHSDMPGLTVSGLSVRYGAVVALDNIDFDVPAHHRVVGLIGPNGAGKSTFIDAVTGFLPRYDGRIACVASPLTVG
jgi:branched-chain amino acid transport system permease protein